MVMGLLYTIYLANCAVLIFFILIQQTKGGGLAGAFGGGGGSDTFFGYTSMQKIGHYTIYAAVSFMVLSLLIANLPFKARTPSVVDFSAIPAGVQQPFEPMDPGAESVLPPVEGAAETSGQAPAPDAAD